MISTICSGETTFKAPHKIVLTYFCYVSPSFPAGVSALADHLVYEVRTHLNGPEGLEQTRQSPCIHTVLQYLNDTVA
jgi:hypothetical protein